MKLGQSVGGYMDVMLLLFVCALTKLQVNQTSVIEEEDNRIFSGGKNKLCFLVSIPLLYLVTMIT
ncbi:hypothetical protein DERP_006763 [Dermatophagoides pteronyssinus]|uniref:Uncharacterized protein n=1 Tax=Dermatophagoides pteronyssinus TaxID=6956 RepID=A0ABQ8IRY1_DERPT|nr:hypothetical protein DERP_006763 [Dermatophagoides pteronyssinus]